MMSAAGSKRSCSSMEDSASETPNQFLCPLSKKVMADPVTCSDGVTYEKDAILNWLVHNKNSPVTNEKLRTEMPVFFANKALKSMIQECSKKQTKEPIQEPAHFVIKIRDLVKRVHDFNANANYTVMELKEDIQKVTGVPTEQQRLVFASKQLEDNRTLACYNIKEGSMLDVVLRLKGC